ncbi:MAG TPA: peptide ABC transporter substrate-binding protein [Clostridia bacterium]|nr:peptide ABC transporter substrate-binding protein [Clostridia bacterium]
MKRILSLLLVMLMVIASLAGCTSKPAAPESAGEPAETKEPEVVQEFSTVYYDEMTTLNYLVTAKETEYGLAGNLVDTLIEYDKYGVIQPCLATDWTVSPDGLVWTLKLRENVSWVTHEGKEYAKLTAQDFVDSMKYILDSTKASQTSQIIYSVIKNAEAYYNGEIKDFSQVGVKAVDANTLEYTLSKPVPYFLSMLNYVCFFPVNGAFLNEMGDRFGTDNTTLLYNGAYILETFEPQTRRVLAKNESYWDKDNVHIQKLNYKYNKEAATLESELFLRGDVSYIEIIPASSLDEWMKDPAKKEMIHPRRTSPYTYFYAFNFDPKFDAAYEPDNWKVVVNNKNFRKSLFHALDRKAAMLTSEPYDPEKRITSTITPKEFATANGLDYTQTGNLAAIASRDSFNESEAMKYKAAALEELKGKAKFPVKILMPYNSGGTEATNRAQVVEQQLEKLLGTDYIDIAIEAYPPTGYLDATRRAGNYALQECNWGPDYADPETYTDPFIRDSNYNFPEFCAEKDENGQNLYEVYEKMLKTAKAELTDLGKRYQLFADAEAYFIDQSFVIPYGLGGGGYTASKLNPLEGPYSAFGVSYLRYKWQQIHAESMNTEEWNAAYATWKQEREAALKNAKY